MRYCKSIILLKVFTDENRKNHNTSKGQMKKVLRELNFRTKIFDSKPALIKLQKNGGDGNVV